jgi:sugar lactone lactonase YvrE
LRNNRARRRTFVLALTVDGTIDFSTVMIDSLARRPPWHGARSRRQEVAMSNRVGFSCLAVVGLALAAQPAVADSRTLFPDTIALPNGWRPEGIAIGGTTIFAGSIPTGAIFAADLVTGRGSVLVPPQTGRAAIGLSFDPRTGLLYVAGGPTGQAYVYNARTGATVAMFQLTTATPTFINDQIITADAVYFTDSMQAQFYRIPLGRGARPSPTAQVATIPLTGDFVQTPGVINSNGIVATAGGRALIVVNSANGVLYRVDPRTGTAKAIDLGGADVRNGDGMLLRGDDLFVVQNQLNQIAVIELDRRAESGEVKQVVTDSRLDVPTTIDSFFGLTYVVNARFSTPPTPDTTYTIEKVRARED